MNFPKPPGPAGRPEPSPAGRPAINIPPRTRLVAGLMLLHQQLPPIIDELIDGTFKEEERRALVKVLSTAIAELEPGAAQTEPLGPFRTSGS